MAVGEGKRLSCMGCGSECEVRLTRHGARSGAPAGGSAWRCPCCGSAWVAREPLARQGRPAPEPQSGFETVWGVIPDRDDR